MEKATHTIMIPLKGGYLVFATSTDDENEAVNEALESLGQAPNLREYDLAFDSGLALIEPITEAPTAS